MEHDKTQTDPGAPPRDSLASLFRHADARPRPASNDTEQVRQALRAEWRGLVQGRRRKRYAALGVAASLVIAAALLVLLPAREPVPAGPVANVARQSGQVLVRAPGMPDTAFRRLAAATVVAGEVVSTGDDALLSLAWADGTSVRMAANSSIALDSATGITLERGSVYLDSPANPRDVRTLQISTSIGVVRHIGTQYLVALDAGNLSVSVREGRVEVRSADRVSTANRGERLSLGASGQLERESIETHGPAWDWAERAAPPLELGGMSALEFVTWAARETGRELVFDNEQARDLAGETRMHGTVNQSPDRALELMLQTSDLVHRIEAGAIHVRLKGDGD